VREHLPRAVTALAVVSVGIAAWPYTVDDAFIIARYAERILDGAGYTMIDGPPTDGVTGPSWILPMLVGVGAAKAFGLLCAALAAALCVERGDRAAWVAAVLLAVQPTLGVWGVAGLETGLGCLLFVGAVRSSGWVAGGAVALLAWVRPECVVGAGVSLLFLSEDERKRGGLVAAAGVAAMVAWRFGFFEVPFLPFRAKGAGPAEGLPYVLLAAVATTGVLGSILVVRGAMREPRIGAAVATHVVVVALVGGDWMPGWRLLAPVLPLVVWLAVQGGASWWPERRALVVVCGAAMAIVPALDLGLQIAPVREAGATRESRGRALAEELARVESVALVDVGYLGWKSRVEILDLGGLTDPEVARAPGGHLEKEVPIGYLDARAPEVVLLHSAVRPRVTDGRLETLAGYPVEQRLAAHPWLQEHYRVERVVPYAPGYWYVWLQR